VFKRHTSKVYKYQVRFLVDQSVCLWLLEVSAKIQGTKDGNDLLTGTRGFDLYTIALQEEFSPTLICFTVKASPTQAWLWHHRLSHLNFETINLLSKNDIMNGLPKLKFVKDQVCSSCEIDNYSRYTWTHFLRSKDEMLEVLIDLLKIVQRGLQGQVITIRTDKGTKFLNKTLHAYFKEEGIDQQTKINRTPEQNDVVERWNHTLVEVARTMLLNFKLPLFF
ncbi:retrovirus-related pol polyprotein from transposon TNT 1-94, partial [Tanacetum coccineum]